MDITLGIVLALATGACGTLIAFDRERGFYPLILIVIATYYILFATIGMSIGMSKSAVQLEFLAAAVFVAIAVTGYKRTLWIVVAGLAAHGLFDLLHAQLISNPGVPSFWPPFCLSYDVVAACYLGVLLMRRHPAVTRI
jgi:hypothetical protein